MQRAATARVAEIRISARAAMDIRDIARFTIRTFGVNQARRYRDDLQRCFESLADNPMLGRSAEALAAKLRRFELRSHVVFYRPDEGGILVVRVLHASTDISSRF
jgi:toxin ParE1/3/4